MTARRFQAVDDLVADAEYVCRRIKEVAGATAPIPYDAPIAAGYCSADMAACARPSRPPRGNTGALLAAGWRFIGVPSYSAPADYLPGGSTRPWLRWGNRLLAVPPERLALKSRVFERREHALAWAKEVTAAGGAAH